MMFPLTIPATMHRGHKGSSPLDCPVFFLNSASLDLGFNCSHWSNIKLAIFWDDGGCCRTLKFPNFLKMKNVKSDEF